MFELFLLLVGVVATFLAGTYYGKEVEQMVIADLTREWDGLSAARAIGALNDVRARIASKL
jgi:hypothetical protein